GLITLFCSFQTQFLWPRNTFCQKKSQFGSRQYGPIFTPLSIFSRKRATFKSIHGSIWGLITLFCCFQSQFLWPRNTFCQKKSQFGSRQYGPIFTPLSIFSRKRAIFKSIHGSIWGVITLFCCFQTQFLWSRNTFCQKKIAVWFAAVRT